MPKTDGVRDIADLTAAALSAPDVPDVDWVEGVRIMASLLPDDLGPQHLAALPFSQKVLVAEIVQKVKASLDLEDPE